MDLGPVMYSYSNSCWLGYLLCSDVLYVLTLIPPSGVCTTPTSYLNRSKIGYVRTYACTMSCMAFLAGLTKGSLRGHHLVNFLFCEVNFSNFGIMSRQNQLLIVSLVHVYVCIHARSLGYPRAPTVTIDAVSSVKGIAIHTPHQHNVSQTRSTSCPCYTGLGSWETITLLTNLPVVFFLAGWVLQMALGRKDLWDSSFGSISMGHTHAHMHTHTHSHKMIPYLSAGPLASIC